MFKKLIILAVVGFAAFRVYAGEEKSTCSCAVDLYSEVLKEYAKKTDVDEILRIVQKRKPDASELEISQIIFHVSQMMNQGWSNERILGYVEGVCVTVPTMPVVKRETKNVSM